MQKSKEQLWRMAETLPKQEEATTLHEKLLDCIQSTNELSNS